MKIKTTLLVMAILTSISCNALNYFWVGGSGNWSDYQNHFATTSGGSIFHNQIPQSTDNVYFDANSFNQPGQIVTVDQTIVQCADLDWTGVTNTPTLFGDYSNTLRIYGSLTLSAGMTFNFGGNISLESTTTGKTITTAGIPINASFIFNGIGGGWTLQDSLSTYWIYLNNGTLNTNNQIVNSGGFWSNTSSARALTTGSSTFNLSGFYMWNITSQGMTLNAANSIIKGTATGSYQYIYGGGLTYNDIFFSATSTGIIYDNNTIHDITFAGSGYIYGSTCNDVSFTGSGTIESGNFHDVSFADDASIYSSTCNNVAIAKNGNIRGTNTFSNLTFSPGYTYILEAGQTQTILTSITVNGNCGALIGIVKSSTINSPATISKASGNVTVSYVTLKDINATGGAIFTANNSIDLGNNSGWTINPLASKNLFWIGNSGNWNDGNHWSTTSGGAPSGCSPLPVDNIFFDANSFSVSGQTVTINVPTAYCKNMDWTGVTNSPTIYGNYSNTLKIYGSLTLANGMSSGFTGNILFEATTTGQTITTAGIPINATLTFNGVGGEWTLQDALSTNVINLNNGILNTNNQTVNAEGFWSNNSTSARTLNTGSSIFNLSSPYYIWNVISQGMTMNAGTSIIKGVATYGYPYFYGGGLTYNDIFFTSGANGIINDINTIHNVSFAADGYINGSNCNDVFFAGVGTVSGGTFHDVSFASNANIGGSAVFNNVTIAKEGTINSSNTFNNLTFTPGFTYILEAGQTQTIGNSLTVNGNCGALIGIVKSSSINSQASIAKASGIVTISFVTLKDINATGGATFIANNAIDLGNNSGWTINVIPSKNLYWVGNGGNWNDGNQWSTSSGGAPSGCSPTPIDNVFFDANSFSLAGQTVTVNTPTALCNNMDWTGVTNSPTIYGNYSNIFKIYGSLTLASSMTWSFSGEIRFEAIATGQTITTAGIPIITTITFNGIGGGWTLNDALTTNIINLNNGVLNTNNQIVNADGFWSTTGSSRTLNMGSSTFNLSSPYNIWYVSSSELTINAGSSLIKGTATGGYPYFYGAGLTYNDIAFTGGANGIIYENNNTIHDISFAGDGYINGGTIHDVSFVGSGSISGGSFHDVSFASNANISGSGIFNNVTIAKQGDINSSNTFNNLTFSPGYTYTLQAGQTQTVQNICAQGNGSLPIRIQSNSVGVPTAISKASGTICWDYVRVSDITATGGASFNAGLAPTYSEDMGGNTGLLFTGGCTALSCTTTCEPPSITAQPDNNSVCDGSNAVFAIVATGTDLTYQWQVNDGTGFTNLSNTAPYNGITTNTLSITTATIGLNGYQYRCMVNGTCAPAATSNGVSLTVNPLPIVTANSSTICSGQTATLTASGAVNYVWSIGGMMGDTTNPISVSPVTTTTYSVTGITNGCSNTAIATVTVNSLPTVSVNSATICSGQTATLTANGATTYTWSNGATTNALSVSPATTTSYTVTGTTIGCSNTAIATVTVNPLPTINVNSATICSGQTATIIASGATNYIWSNGANTNSITVSPTTTTSYTVTGTSNGCSNTAIATVTVNPLPTVSVNSATVCAGQTTTLIASGATNYTWSTGANTNSITVSPASTTSYTVTGTSNGCSNTAVGTIIVNSLPTVTVNSTTICTGESATLGASGATNYTWSTGETTNSISVSPASTATYTVTGTNNGCSNTAIATVTVNSAPIVTVNSATITSGQTATLTASGANIYSWSTGETTNPISVSPVTTTPYTVTGTSNGCSNTAIATVTVNTAPTEPEVTITPEGLFDNVFDKDGRKYSLKNLLIPGIDPDVNPQSIFIQCSSGYFNLYYEVGSGMEGSSPVEVARRNVLCQVLNDISAFIPAPAGSPLATGAIHVNLWVKNINNLILNANTSSILAAASSFYTLPSISNTPIPGGIADNEVYKTIISGYDSYTNVASPLIQGNAPNGAAAFYHGLITLNFSNPSINWETNLTVTSTALQDMYGVVLHEITHALGITSLINYNGTSKLTAAFPYYSRFDNFLTNSAGNHLITSGSTGCSSSSLYNCAFNLNSSIITPGCTANPPVNTGATVNNTVCSNALYYTGTTVLPLYTSACFEEGSSLSHFEDQCYPTGTPYGNDTYFTMSNGQNAGTFKRYLKPEERIVLCDLGYRVNGTYGSSAVYNSPYNYGTSACSGTDVIGLNDGLVGSTFQYITSIGGTPLTINNILNNDVDLGSGGPIPASFECLEVIYGGGTVAPSAGTTFTYTPSATSGIILLRYIPVSHTGKRGNITYIYIYNQSNFNCTPGLCNMVPNGNFEQYIVPPSGSTGTGQINKACGWGNANGGSCDYFINNSLTPTFVQVPCNAFGVENDNQGGNAYAGFVAVSGVYELLYTKLSSPLTANTTYQITLDASLSEGYSAGSFPLQICFAQNYTQSSLYTITPPASGFSYIYLTAPSPIINTNGWTPVSITFTTGNNPGVDFGQDYLILGNVQNLPIAPLTPTPVGVAGCTLYQPASAGFSYIYVDNIELKPISTVTFTPPSTTCVGSIITLSDFVSVNGGTFSGPGVSGNTFTASTAGIGTHTLTYTYTNNLGCVMQTSAVVNVVNSTFTVSVNSATICVGQTAILTANGATSYSWSTGATTNSISVSPATTSTYTVTGTSTGCSSSVVATVTVNPTPVATANPVLQKICSGATTAIALTSNVTGTTFAWTVSQTNISGATNSSGTSIAQTLNTTGIAQGTAVYTITPIANGCAGTSITVTVTVDPVPTSTFNTPPNQYLCFTPNSFTFTNTGNSGAGYSQTWNFGGAVTNTSTAVSPTGIMYATAGTYTVTHIVTNTATGCSSTTTATITVNPVPCTAGLTIHYYIPCAGTTTSAVFNIQNNGGQAVIAKNISISGVLTVNFNTSFQNCKIVMAPGARIVVNPNVTLSLDDKTHIFSCSNMWDGIYLNGSNSQLIINNDVFIEDAINAIVVPPNGGTYFIGGAIFNKNLTALKVTGRSNPGIIRHSIITSRGNLYSTSATVTNRAGNLTGYTKSNLKAPYSDRTGLYGINATDVSNLWVGDNFNGAGFTNTFDAIMCGINLTRTNATIYNNKFQNLLLGYLPICDGGQFPLPPPPCLFESGIGIQASGSTSTAYSITVGGTGGYQSNTFLNTHTAISVTNYKTTSIVKNSINNTSTGSTNILNPGYGNRGIFVRPTMWDNSTDVMENNINNCNTGILVTRMANGGGVFSKWVFIDHNTVTANSSGRCTNGITIQDPTNSGTPFTNTDKVKIQYNTVQQANNCITATNVNRDLAIRGNNIQVRNNGTTGSGTGIRLQNCKYAKVHDNPSITLSPAVSPPTQIKNTNINYKGISVITSPNSQITCNNISKMGESMTFVGSCINSTLRNNKMTGGNRGLVLRSNGEIGTQGSATDPRDFWWSTSPAATAVFTAQTYTDGTTNANTNSKLWVNNNGAPAGHTGVPTLNLNAINAIPYSSGSGIKTATGGPFDCSTIKIITTGLRSMGAGSILDTAQLTDLAFDTAQYPVYEQEHRYQHKLYAFDELDASIDSSVGTALQHFYDSTQLATLGQLKAVDKALALNDYALADATNSEVLAGNLMETNQQQFNTLYLLSLNDTAFKYSQAEKDAIYAIAIQCPLEGGNGVWQARVLFSAIENNLIEFDDNCISDSNRKLTINNKVESTNFILYPNPNDGTMELAYILNANETGIFELYDITGKHITNYVLDGSSNKLNIDNIQLNSGIYYYNIRVNEKVIKTEKIVIIK